MIETEAKYYIPGIEEFYVGFEFEHFNYEGKLVSNSKCNKQEWHKEICDADWFNILLDDYEHDEEAVKDYRVKYLDAEDLQSLGFVFAKENGETAFVKNIDPRNDWTISLGDDNKVFIDRNTDTYLTAIPSKKETWECIPVFRGRVKNKSELKQVLKMIGV